MKTYIVNTEWSGYCRGDAVFSIVAKNEEEAKEIFFEGEKLNHSTIRSDIEHSVISVKESEEL